LKTISIYEDEIMEIIKLIQDRHSTRAPFTEKSVAKEDVMLIIEAARWAPTAHNMQNFEIIIIDDKKILEKIGKVRSPPSEEFIRENFQQLSMSEDELKKKKIGILGANFPASWRDARRLDEAIKDMTPTPLSYTIKNSPCVLIVVYDSRKRAPASKGDILGFLSLGCAMENMWLVAESLGIGFQIMSVFSGKELSSELKKILDIPEYMKVAFAVRLGYAPEMKYLRVRRNAEDFTHHNMFGKRI
jgi:nitroreductase